MRRGDFAAAWEVSDAVLRHRLESREDCSQWPRHLQFIWNGAAFDDKHVFVRCYHGLGDTIQFARLLEPLRERAREVTLWVQPALLELLRSVRGIDRLVPLHLGVPDLEFDVDVEIMELAHALRIDATTLPNSVPYIYVSPDPEVRLPPASLNVGVAWRSGDWNDQRSIPTGLIEHLNDVPGVRLYSLQYPEAAPETFAGSLACENIAAMARSMLQLDLVISVDTMVSHLAGALGLPTWTVLGRDTDWRWMEKITHTPWYPTMRLIRSSDDRWQPVLKSVRDALTDYATDHSTIAARDTRSACCRASSS